MKKLVLLFGAFALLAGGLMMSQSQKQADLAAPNPPTYSPINL